MKKSLHYFIACILFVFYTGLAFGQCTPDPTVTDPEGNGEMTPDTLMVFENTPFNITHTIIAPDSVTVTGLGTITIHHITVKSLQNKPSWLSYQCTPTNCEFTGTTARCVKTSGTPPAGSAGYIPVSVIVDVFTSPTFCISCVLYPNGYDPGMPLIIWVRPQGMGIAEQATKGIKIIEPQPNPFSSTLKLGCYTENSQKVSLKVMNMVGQEIYTEQLNTNAGENYFAFNGIDLTDGLYFYSIVDENNRITTKKFIKSR